MQLRLLGVGSGHNLWVLMPKAITSESKNKHGDHIKRESSGATNKPKKAPKRGSVCTQEREKIFKVQLSGRKSNEKWVAVNQHLGR